MLTEEAADKIAGELENIILDAMEASDWEDVRSTVKSFVRKNLYEWYVQRCEDSYGLIHVDERIKREFE